MDRKRVARECLRLAKAIMESEDKKFTVKAKARKVKASKRTTVGNFRQRLAARRKRKSDDDADVKEDTGFNDKIKGLRPTTLKKLNTIRNKKVKQVVDGISITQNLTVEDLIDLLNQLIANA